MNNNLYFDIPPDIKWNGKKRNSRSRKCGKKGGIKSRCRKRGYRVPLPTIMVGNLRSIRNKTDELEACTRYLSEYRESGMLCFTETWLSEVDPDRQIPNFTMIRSDRTEASKKKCGGRVCLYVNEKYYKNICVHEKYCDPNIELLVVGLRPFYMPGEFTNISTILVYIPPDGNYKDPLKS